MNILLSFSPYNRLTFYLREWEFFLTRVIKSSLSTALIIKTVKSVRETACLLQLTQQVYYWHELYEDAAFKLTGKPSATLNRAVGAVLHVSVRLPQPHSTKELVYFLWLSIEQNRIVWNHLALTTSSTISTSATSVNRFTLNYKKTAKITHEIVLSFKSVLYMLKSKWPSGVGKVRYTLFIYVYYVLLIRNS